MTRFKKRRLELGLTLEEVGKIVQVDKSTILKWESGLVKNMKRDKIALYAKALNISPLAILEFEFDKNNELSIVEKYLKLSSKSKEKVDDYINLIYNTEISNTNKG